jgi:molybdenum cofactor guanylyltransferase
MDDEITAIILAGGHSVRMGMSKAMVIIEGRTAIERMHALMHSVFGHVIIISNEPEHYTHLGSPCYADEFPGAGPVAGIHAGLLHSHTQRNFVIACDMLLMSGEMIRYLADYPTLRPVTVAEAEGEVHYLCGIYMKQCLPIAESMLKEHAGEAYEIDDVRPARECSARALCELAGMETVDAGELPFYSRALFFNMNRPDDLDYIRTRLHESVNPHSALQA